MDEQQQNEQGRDMRDLALKDVAECKMHFDRLRQTTKQPLALEALAATVARVLSDLHNKDFTSRHLGF